MFDFVDRWIEKKLLEKFRKKDPDIMDEILDTFKKNYPNIIESDFKELCEKIAKEFFRVCHITNRSLCRAGIARAKYTFLGTAAITTLITGSLGAFSGGSFLPFIAPLASAFSAMILSLITIEIPYTQRVKAGYDSVITSFLDDKPYLQQKDSKTSTALALMLFNKHKPVFSQVPVLPSSDQPTPVIVHIHEDPTYLEISERVVLSSPSKR